MHRTRTRPLPTGAIDPRMPRVRRHARRPVVPHPVRLRQCPLGLPRPDRRILVRRPLHARSQEAHTSRHRDRGISGALPPVIGIAAAQGRIGVEALILFLIMFIWQPPHFWARRQARSRLQARRDSRSPRRVRLIRRRSQDPFLRRRPPSRQPFPLLLRRRRYGISRGGVGPEPRVPRDGSGSSSPRRSRSLRYFSSRSSTWPSCSP